MALQIYDENQVVIPSTSTLLAQIRTRHDGNLGGADDVKFYIRNNDSAKYYQNITLKPDFAVSHDTGSLGDSSWLIKVIYGERRPTEREWDTLRAGEAISIPDIGTTGGADTSTYHPIWMRVVCPGGTGAQIRQQVKLSLKYWVKNVGD